MYNSDGSDTEVHSPAPAETTAEDPVWSSHQISPSPGSSHLLLSLLPHAPGLSRQQELPAGQQGDARDGRGHRAGQNRRGQTPDRTGGDASFTPAIFHAMVTNRSPASLASPGPSSGAAHAAPSWRGAVLVSTWGSPHLPWLQPHKTTF